MLSRRTFLVSTAGGLLTLWAWDHAGTRVAVAAGLPGPSLNAGGIPQFTRPLLIPGTMPRARRLVTASGPVDYYEIAVRQFRQQILPDTLPMTTVWGYGSSAQSTGRSVFHSPALTIEATQGVPVRIRWANELVDADGKYLPHLLPVDPTLHWANPGRSPGHGGMPATDIRPDFDGLTYVPVGDYTDPATQYTRYTGPVPLVTHLHGAMGIGDESDGYPEAWYLPAATNLGDHAPHGTWWEFFAEKARTTFGAHWDEGTQVAQYPNKNRASTLWFHDHALGLTRLNVYAGPAGFFLVRGGPGGEEEITDTRTGRRAVLPGLAKGGGAGSKATLEIPLAIQDRSFNDDGSLFYPDSRSFFDGFEGPFVPATDVSPMWNPEFFGNTLMVNGRTWPFVEVEQRRYRLRLLNGCQSRVLLLDFTALPGAKVHQIGNDGGLLPDVLDVTTRDHGQLLLGPAERADVILDLTDVPLGAHVLTNLGPDEPYGGGVPGVDFPVADPSTTGRVLEFRVGRRVGADLSTPGDNLALPAIVSLPDAVATRRVALLEHMHGEGSEEAPTAAMLGVLREEEGHTHAVALGWMDEVTENPERGDTEVWEVYNLTADAHPVHVHEVAFEVLGRQDATLDDGMLSLGAETHPPLPGETGRKDTVLAYPGQVTRIKARFDYAGQFVWHCHILEHEDNEMMRPYRVGPVQSGQPVTMPHEPEPEHEG